MAPLAGRTEFHVRNLDDFGNTISDLQLQEDEVLVSFDVVSLFTTIPTHLSMEIAMQRLLGCEKFNKIILWIVKDIYERIDIYMKA